MDQYLGALPAGYATPGLNRYASSAVSTTGASRGGAVIRAQAAANAVGRAHRQLSGGLGAISACGKTQRTLNTILGIASTIATVSGNSTASAIGGATGALNTAWSSACTTEAEVASGTGTGGNPAGASADLSAFFTMQAAQAHADRLAAQAAQDRRDADAAAAAEKNKQMLIYGAIGLAVVGGAVLLLRK